jgi:hypothetical protein
MSAFNEHFRNLKWKCFSSKTLIRYNVHGNVTLVDLNPVQVSLGLHSHLHERTMVFLRTSYIVIASHMLRILRNKMFEPRNLTKTFVK